MDKALNFPGTGEDYFGFALHRFKVDGCDCVVVEPRNPRPGRQWVWKAEYFPAFPAFELEMLNRGFYFAFIQIEYECGSPGSLAHWDEFYCELTAGYGFARRAILFGLSVGGLYIYNWAAKHPDCVACLYGDNPVCDFKSWPGAKGKSPGNSEVWKTLIDRYRFPDEAAALAYRGNPVDNLAPLIRAGIPLVHAAATEDEVVPIAENTDVLERNCHALGGEITVFRHPGGHHPHGLPDLSPLIDWILRHGIGVD